MDFSYNNKFNPAFGLRIKDNRAFRQVLSTAKYNKKFLELDSTLNSLLHVKGNDIVIIHGYTKEGAIYSTFLCGEKSVLNNTTGCQTPAQASLKAILDLVDKDNPKLMQLLGSRVKRFISEAEIINRYTIK